LIVTAFKTSFLCKFQKNNPFLPDFANGLFFFLHLSVVQRMVPRFNQGRSAYTQWFLSNHSIYQISKGQKSTAMNMSVKKISYSVLWLFVSGWIIKAPPSWVIVPPLDLSVGWIPTHEGMFLRKSFEITPWIYNDKPNVLAVIVHPPDHPGNPNGGQSGDGTIARDNTMQYMPGYDWCRPIRDRNTGIWDEGSIFINL
jgi:hypothetical protein